jgi:hypothetical protein
MRRRVNGLGAILAYEIVLRRAPGLQQPPQRAFRAP